MDDKSRGLTLDDDSLWDKFFKHTVVGLKDYVDMRFSEAEKAKDNALHSIEIARKEAQGAMERRLEGMNEFRDQLRDQASKFLTRTEYDSGHTPMEEKINSKVNWDEFKSFREQTNVTLEDYKINKAILATKASMNTVVIGYVFTAITLIVAIISILLRFIGK